MAVRHELSELRLAWRNACLETSPEWGDTLTSRLDEMLQPYKQMRVIDVDDLLADTQRVCDEFSAPPEEMRPLLRKLFRAVRAYTPEEGSEDEEAEDPLLGDEWGSSEALANFLLDMSEVDDEEYTAALAEEQATAAAVAAATQAEEEPAAGPETPTHREHEDGDPFERPVELPGVQRQHQTSHFTAKWDPASAPFRPRPQPTSYSFRQGVSKLRLIEAEVDRVKKIAAVASLQAASDCFRDPKRVMHRH